MIHLINHGTSTKNKHYNSIFKIHVKKLNKLCVIKDHLLDAPEHIIEDEKQQCFGTNILVKLLWWFNRIQQSKIHSAQMIF